MEAICSIDIMHFCLNVVLIASAKTKSWSSSPSPLFAICVENSLAQKIVENTFIITTLGEATKLGLQNVLYAFRIRGN